MIYNYYLKTYITFKWICLGHAIAFQRPIEVRILKCKIFIITFFGFSKQICLFFCRKCFVDNRCIANSQGRSGRPWSRSAVFLNRVTSAHLEEVLMQKPHSFFLSAPRPHARQTTRVRERGTVKSVYTIYLPELSNYTYFHDDIFFFILQVVPSKGVDWCRDASGRAKKVSCHVCGGEKNPHGIELRSSFVFISFLSSSSSFSMLSRKDGGVWREFFSWSSVSGTYREECCSSSLPWPVVSAASASPLSQPTSWEPR